MIGFWFWMVSRPDWMNRVSGKTVPDLLGDDNIFYIARQFPGIEKLREPDFRLCLYDVLANAKKEGYSEPSFFADLILAHWNPFQDHDRADTVFRSSPVFSFSYKERTIRRINNC